MWNNIRVPTIMSNVGKDISSFVQLFWQEQKKSLSVTADGIIHHPMIIRFCLSIASKSPSAYDELRSSNILTLPSRRTLREYRNAIRPKGGSNKEVIHEPLMFNDMLYFLLTKWRSSPSSSLTNWWTYCFLRFGGPRYEFCRNLIL